MNKTSASSSRPKSEIIVRANLKATLTSTFLFILSYILTTLVLQGVISALARSFRYAVTMTYNHVYALPKDYHRWSKARIIAVYFTAPLFCLGLGILIWIILNSNSRIPSRIRLFMFWLMICFANIFFGQIVCSPLGIRAEHESFYQTFAIVGTWMFISPSVMTFFATMAGVISIVFGVYIYRELLRFSIPGKAVKTGKDGLAFIFQLYAIPIIIGSVPLVLLCNHFSLYTFAFIFANLMLIGFGMAIMNGGRKFWVKSSKTKALWRTPVIEMTLAVVAWACIYLFFRG